MVLALNTSVTTPGLPTLAGQLVDITLLGVELYSSLLPGVLNSFFVMSPGGTWGLTYTAGPIGSVVCLQTAVVDPAASPAPDPFTLSAAFCVTVVPGCVPVDLMLGDDTFVAVPLVGWMFPFYDVAYAAVFVNSNGRLTFGAGDTDFTETEAEMRGDPPSINMFWDDLTPAAGGGAGTVSACEDPAACTFTAVFAGVAEFVAVGANSCTVIIDGSGTISTAYGACSLMDAITGICPGLGVDPIVGSGVAVDLSTCFPAGCPAPFGKSLFQIFPGAASPFDLSGLTITYVPMTLPANTYTAF
jgi:hypothetical protein